MSTTEATREAFYKRIYDLPPGAEREEAIALAIEVYGDAPLMRRDAQELKRDPAQRRAMAGDPWKYFRDVFGYTLTSKQEEALELIEREDRVLIPSATNQGKSFLAACYVVYRFDAVGSSLDLEGKELGASILLPGPNHKTILNTIYANVRAHVQRAEARGFLMPGVMSERGVNWSVNDHPHWKVEAFAPPQKVGQSVTHTASGRHHSNQIAMIEEASGVSEPLWVATEGMCSSRGNKIVALYNPTESSGAAFTRYGQTGYRVLHFSAFDHPNVRSRSVVVPGAIDFANVDSRVRDQCKDRGEWPVVAPDDSHRDFVYGLPDLHVEELGPRKDGRLGMEGCSLHVYRPDPSFEAQVLGQYPSGFDNRLFGTATLDQSRDRWKASKDPEDAPNMVGVDAARRGSDDTCAAPRWGGGAEELLRSYAQARDEGGVSLERFFASHGARVGLIRTLPKGDGVAHAEELCRLYPDSPFNVDEGGGQSEIDHLTHVMGKDVYGVSFGSEAPEPTPGEPWSHNLRTALYVRAARLVALGLVDVPWDPMLRQELLACELKHRFRTVKDPESGKKVRKPCVLLIEKDEIKKAIGRSPDKADAFVLALLDGPPRELPTFGFETFNRDPGSTVFGDS